MAFQEVRDFLIKLRTDSSGVVQGNTAAQRSFTELNQALELTRKAMNALESVGQALDRGNNFNQIARGFEAISKSAGVLADEQLSKLRAAVGGTVTDLQLMEQANKAVLLGLDATKLEVMAEAAQRLGAAVGRTGTEAFNDLVTGVGRGSALILDNLGVIVNTEDAYKKFAKQLGVTAEQLSEAGKKAAFQEAAFKAIQERAEKLPQPVNDAGRAFEALKTDISNYADQASAAIARNKVLAEGIDNFRNGIAVLIPYVSTLTSALADLADSKSIGFQSFSNEFTAGARAILGGIADNIPGAEGFAKAQREEIAKLYNIQKQLGEEKNKQAATNQYSEMLKKEQEAMENLNRTTKANTDDYIDNTKAQKDTAKASDEITKKLEEQKKAYTDLTLELKENSIKKNMEQALEKLDPNSFNLFFDQYSKVFGERVYNGLLEQLGSPDKAQELTSQMLDLEKAQWAEEMQLKMEEAFQGSVDFFADLLTPMFEGQAANFEDIFIDAAKRVAIGFASQLAASVAAEWGISGISNIGSAQGLGQMLASYLWNGGGAGSSGGGSWGNLLSGASSLYSGYNYLMGGSSAAQFSTAAAADYATISGYYEGSAGLYGSGSAATTASLASTAGIIAAVAGGAYLFYEAVKTFDESNKEAKDAIKAGAQTYLAGDGTGFSQLYFALAGNFNGSNDPGTLIRRELRGSLQETGLGEDLTFRGVRGEESIFNSRYTQDLSNPLNADAIALANPIANVFSSGDDTYGPQLAAMFADATDNAENFNEVLINTRSLMDKMGVNTEELKIGLSELFLDGKISLEEYGSGLQQLNVLATDNLVGPNSISDAINILAKNIDDNPRVALKGLELGFKEMAEVGIDTQEEIRDYVTNNFSPEIADAFDKLLAAGIDTWEEVGKAGPDAIFLIADALDELKQNAIKASEDTGDAIVSNIADSADRAKRRVDDLNSSLQNLNKTRVSPIASANPNQPNNPRPA